MGRVGVVAPQAHRTAAPPVIPRRAPDVSKHFGAARGGTGDRKSARLGVSSFSSGIHSCPFGLCVRQYCVMHSQLVKGVMDLLVLASLGPDERYGYEIVQTLTAAGLSELNEATVYGTLRRLEAARLLRSRHSVVEGRARRYYRLTAKGEARLAHLRDDWQHLRSVVCAIDPDAARETPLR